MVLNSSGPSPQWASNLDPGWEAALRPVAVQLRSLEVFLENEVAEGFAPQPSPENVLRAFRYPFDQVKVLLVGQDPYPTAGDAVGLSFSVAPDSPLPRSLRNIFAELSEDLGVPPANSGDLSGWADQGVCLLNRVLTVRAGAAGSHRRRGWEEVTDCAISALAARNTPLVAVLWGRDAQAVRPLLDGVPIVESAHPSPLSARRGFFGSRPFSQVNELLIAEGATPICWDLNVS